MLQDESETVYRRWLYAIAEGQAAKAAATIVYREGISPSKFLIVVIPVDDPVWRDLALYIEPKIETYLGSQAEQALLATVVFGRLLSSLMENIVGLSSALERPLAPGLAYTIVLTKHGYSLFETAFGLMQRGGEA